MSLLLTALTSGYAQDVQKLDPALDRLIAADTRLERVATGFNKWTEGPVWTRDGSLLFAEIPANNIIRWKPGEAASVFMHPSGYVGATPYAGPEPGSNGMTLDADGRVAVAGHARRNVWRLESVDPKAQITVLADAYQGKKLSSPNDLVYQVRRLVIFHRSALRIADPGGHRSAERAAGEWRIPHSRGAPTRSRCSARERQGAAHH